MTEREIESRVQRALNRLDREFLSSPMTQDEYEELVRRIDQWANHMLDQVA